jgi:hypothetical protein
MVVIGSTARMTIVAATERQLAPQTANDEPAGIAINHPYLSRARDGVSRAMRDATASSKRAAAARTPGGRLTSMAGALPVLPLSARS